MKIKILIIIIKLKRKKKVENGLKINNKKDAYIILDSISLEKNGASYR